MTVVRLMHVILINHIQKSIIIMLCICEYSQERRQHGNCVCNLIEAQVSTIYSYKKFHFIHDMVSI